MNPSSGHYTRQKAGQSNGMSTYGTSLVFITGSHITIGFTLMKVNSKRSIA
jgi:hypothetical protein